LTERLYYHDSYLQTFNAQVVSQSEDGLRIVLDRTAFYPTSGGQPHDLGALNGIPVLDVIDRDATIEHLLAQPLACREVTGQIDWPRRLSHMQQHTAQHLLSAVLQEEFGLQTVSFHLGTEESTVDVEPPNAESLSAMETRANQVLRLNKATHVSFEDASTAQGLRKKSDRDGLLRIVSIEGLDRSACGGTHVARTGEIGLILLGKTEKIRKALRIYFYAGDRAFAYLRKQLSDLRQAESQARDKLADSEKSRQKLAAELASLRGAQRYASGQRRWVESVNDIGEAERAEANAFLNGQGTTVLLYSPSTGAILIGAEPSTGIDCAQLLKQAASQRNGRGGGSPKLAQGNLGPNLDANTLALDLSL